MKQLQKLATAVLATALVALAGASTASATTLEVKGAKQTGAVTFKASLRGASTLMKDTSGGFFGTCTASTMEVTTSVFSGTTVSGPLKTLTFASCTTEPVVVDAAGTLSIENISGTTNGTVRSNGLKLTEASPFGNLTCTTSNTDFGTFTGASSGTATIDVNAVINCGAFLPSARWEGAYTVTTPEGLGATS